MEMVRLLYGDTPVASNSARRIRAMQALPTCSKESSDEPNPSGLEIAGPAKALCENRTG